jgi:CheY-like chemotaxis protein/HPt (histidine-containing phosphotransfer) domain-containing protein
MMGGDTGVDSVPGKGSSFWFTARLGLGGARRPAPQPTPDLRGRHILVVDDNDNARQVMGEMLGAMSFAVDTARSGDESLACVAAAERDGHPYDLVCMDWRMPGMDGIETCRRLRDLPIAATPHLLLVTAYGREEVFREAESAGIRDILVKPVSASMMFDTVMRVLHDDPDRLARNSPERVESVSGMAGLEPIAGARLLLVEDNELNQEVALELLRQAGFAVDLAENGKVALERLAATRYDLVLMDMQMPEMDGIEATEALRRMPGLATLPVVAMTANAQEADRKRCLAAGMNDFLAKPIEPTQLWNALRRWIPARLPHRPAGAVAPVAAPRADAVPPAPTFDPGIAGLDPAPALNRMLGNTVLYLAMARKFCAQQPNIVAEIAVAYVAGDVAKAHRILHSIKGSAASIGAIVIAGRAAELEERLRGAPPQTLQQLRPQLDAFIAELHQFVAALSQHLPAAGDAGTEGGQPPAAAPLAELEALLADNDPEAIAWMERHGSPLRRQLPRATVVALDVAIRSFDVDEALRLLRSEHSTAQTEQVTP